MDFDLYSSDNDEESSEMSLGVCGSLSSSEDDDSTSLFGMGTSHSESNKELHRLQGDVHGKVPVLLTAEDFLHIVFTSEEEAYNAYKEFAWTRGFGVRKGDVGWVDGVLVRQDIFCHRQGTRSDKHYDRPERVREERLESRTDCKAKLKIYYDVHDNVWRVRKIIDEHNHDMAPAAFCNLLPSHRKMSDGDKAQVNSMKQFGIPTSKIMAYMAGQSGGYSMLRFTKRDLYNYVHNQRRARILDGDAAATISYLEGKANADLMSVARYTTTADNRLGNLFWVDGIMKSDYELFGDVLAFNATYRGNKYKKPLVVFSGINHHRQTCIFGFALLQDEEVRTYKWVLLNLLDVMGQRRPNLVVTDGDKAMRAAIAEVMPSAKHRLCAWHLEKNCFQRVKEAEFRKVFKKAIYANFDVDEFERYWRTSIESLSLGQNTWVQSTYDIKESWATAYLRGTFCAGYRTTSRCEGINSFIKAFLKSTDSILELVHSLDRVVKDYRNNEVTAQFYSTYYTPVLSTGLDAIELSASKLYTRAVFREVKKQIKGVATLLFQGRESINTTIVYSFSKMGRPDRVFKVLYDPNDRKIECECKMWDSDGIPCSHIFCVMKYEGMEEIPETLVLRRWCKIAKDCTTLKTGNDSRDQARLLRYSALYLALSHVVTLGCEEVEDFALAHDAISNLVDILQRRRVEKDGNKVLPNNKCGVKDPTMAATKGAPKRGKANLCASEEEPKLKRRCTKCGVPGHTRRTCAGHDLKAVRVGSEAASSAFAESSFAHVKSTERSTSLRREVPFEEGPKVTSSRSQGGAPLGMTPTQSNVSRFAPSGGGGNIFLGGQRIDHFYATPTCGPTSSVPCYSPSFVPGVIHSGSHGASTSLGSEAIERWILENVIGLGSSVEKNGALR
ncbi:hypothetical protein Ahy_A07g034513 [Arachis hypogaea]|uniref:Uncharacterized protein n=2 Tax=Arachis TaxID=3817 RepID=A0A445CC21_ARAHY|nr:hypothetical protein Ahy_A07g034513 [Arachis hypogaea]